ncbi:hypothetical protein [Rhodococcus sp. M8-35]
MSAAHGATMSTAQIKAHLRRVFTDDPGAERPGTARPDERRQ